MLVKMVRMEIFSRSHLSFSSSSVSSRAVAACTETKMKTRYITWIFILGTLHILQANGQTCTLNDIQKTKGICKDVVECPFAKEQLKAGVKPTICSGRVVCCPTEPTLSAKKCEEYKEYHRQAIGWGPPLENIMCLIPPKQFISGGRTAELYEYPFVAALGWGNSEEDLRFHCTGTLISEQFVLTAGHCLTSAKGKPSYALLGDIALTPDKATDDRVIVKIQDWILHPQYKPPITYNDIALLKLAEPVSLSRYLLPACLPQSSLGVKTGDDPLEAAGFGLLGPGEPQTNILQAVNLTAFTTSGCGEYYNNAADKSTRFPNGIVKTQLCAGDKTDSGKDTCNGDSGGPLTINNEHRCVFHVMGVTSFGARLCGYGTPAIFTKVFSYNNWIESVVWPDGK